MFRKGCTATCCPSDASDDGLQGWLARADTDALHLHSCNYAHNVVAEGSCGLPRKHAP